MIHNKVNINQIEGSDLISNTVNRCCVQSFLSSRTLAGYKYTCPLFLRSSSTLFVLSTWWMEGYVVWSCPHTHTGAHTHTPGPLCCGGGLLTDALDLIKDVVLCLLRVCYCPFLFTTLWKLYLDMCVCAPPHPPSELRCQYFPGSWISTCQLHCIQ